MGQAMVLEPEHLHLSLDPGVGVMVPVVGQVPSDFGSEGDRPHGSDSMMFPGRSPSVVYRLTRPHTTRARPGRAEYNSGSRQGPRGRPTSSRPYRRGWREGNSLEGSP